MSKKYFLFFPILLLLFNCSTNERRDNEEYVVISSENAWAEIPSVVTMSHLEFLEEDSLKQVSVLVLDSFKPEKLSSNQQNTIERYVEAGGGLLLVNSPLNTPYTWPWYEKFSEAKTESHEMALASDESPVIQTFGHGLVSYVQNKPSNTASTELLKTLTGNNSFDYTQLLTPKAPDNERFSKVILDDFDLDEPMELTVLPDGKVVYIERRGKMKMYDPATEKVKLLANFDVCVEGNYEDGMLGLCADPNFETNNWIYLYYSPPCENWYQRLSRFRLASGDSLILASEKEILQVPVQRETCCHSGGSVTFGPDGLLYLSTGDNTSSKESDGATPIDERPGRAPFDAQKSSGNANDLRGAVLRLDVHDDGSYSIPDGNLFAKDGSAGRPEIYAMGCRNPFRIHVDQKTNYLYWGDVGPDAGSDNQFGKASTDEFNQARKAGNFGWPYFMGNNIAFPDRDFTDDSVSELYDPLKPINDSPNNTGPKVLPPATPAYIWYAKSQSETFPMLGQGSNSAMAGPVYYVKDQYLQSEVRLPDYYEGKWFMYEWARDWIKVATMDENGDLVKIEDFLPEVEISNPIDLEVGPDGALYLLEYGSNYFLNNPDAKLVRIEYASANRLPKPKIKVDQKMASAGSSIALDASSSIDPDKEDELTFEWMLSNETIGTGVSLSHTFATPGDYEVTLKATDQKGAVSSISEHILIGNEPPELKISHTGNQTFFFPGDRLNYKATVTDLEDDQAGTSNVNASMINFAYVAEGGDAEVLLGESSKLVDLVFAKGKNLLASSDCSTCHDPVLRSVGPSHMEVSQKYQGDEGIVAYLTEKIMNGGNGVWGEKIMPGHPQHTQAEIEEMVIYIMAMADEKYNGGLPANGAVTFENIADVTTDGIYLLSATYEDQGANDMPSITVRENKILRSPRVSAESADEKAKAFDAVGGKARNIPVTFLRNEGFLKYEQVDLSGISNMKVLITTSGGGTLTLRSGSPEGAILAKVNVPASTEQFEFKTLASQVKASNKTTDVYLVAECEKGLGGVAWIQFEK